MNQRSQYTQGADKCSPAFHDRLDESCHQRSDERFKDIQTMCLRHGLVLQRAEGFVLTSYGKQFYLVTLQDVLNAVESLRSLDVNYQNSHEEAFLAFIMNALGAAPENISPGQSRRFSTNGKRSNSSGACLMFPDGRGGICTDFRHGVTHVWSATAASNMTHQEREAHRKSLKLAQAQQDLRQLMEQVTNARLIQDCLSKSLSLQKDDPVMRYFARRGMSGALPTCLRLHPKLAYYGERFEDYFPAMIAPLVTPDGSTVALHRTYLTQSGEKAPVDIPKKLSRRSGPLDGACIPLHSPLNGTLGIAEGIETSQAAHLLFGVPTVAAYCASNLSKFVWPPGLQRLVIFADHDDAGLRSADSLDKRAQRAGLQVEIFMPSDPGDDWCDVLQRTPKLGKEVTQ